jgi:hypothetical protein
MRPTINEQLEALSRLLTKIANECELPPTTLDLLTNAGRIVTQVRASWASVLPFLIADNQAMMATLIQVSAVVPQEPEEISATSNTTQGSYDVAKVAERNSELRLLLANSIRSLPRTVVGNTARAAIARSLANRIDADPS